MGNSGLVSALSKGFGASVPKIFITAVNDLFFVCPITRKKQFRCRNEMVSEDQNGSYDKDREGEITIMKSAGQICGIFKGFYTFHYNVFSS